MTPDEERRLLATAEWYNRRTRNHDRPSLEEIAAHFGVNGNGLAAVVVTTMVDRDLIHPSALGHI